MLDWYFHLAETNFWATNGLHIVLYFALAGIVDLTERLLRPA